jgi:hypothetical protein
MCWKFCLLNMYSYLFVEQILMPESMACFEWYNCDADYDMIDFVFRKDLIPMTFSWGGKRLCQGHSESMTQTSSRSGQKFMVLVCEMMMMAFQFSINMLAQQWKCQLQSQHNYTNTTQIHKNKTQRKKNNTYNNSSSSKIEYWHKSPMSLHQITLHSECRLSNHRQFKWQNISCTLTHKTY